MLNHFIVKFTVLQCEKQYLHIKKAIVYFFDKRLADNRKNNGCNVTNLCHKRMVKRRYKEGPDSPVLNAYFTHSVCSLNICGFTDRTYGLLSRKL